MKSDRERQIQDITHMQNLKKNDTNEPFNKQTDRHRKQA